MWWEVRGLDGQGAAAAEAEHALAVGIPGHAVGPFRLEDDGLKEESRGCREERQGAWETREKRGTRVWEQQQRKRRVVFEIVERHPMLQEVPLALAAQVMS